MSGLRFPTYLVYWAPFLIATAPVWGQPPQPHGEWSAPVIVKPPGFTYATQCIHAALTPYGKVLAIDMTTHDGLSAEVVLIDPTDPDPASILVVNAIWDKATEQHLFCSGHAWTRDGKLVLAGGGEICSVFEGQEFRTTFYLPSPTGPGQLVSGPDELRCPFSDYDCDPGPPITTRRWYPTVITLGTGHLLVLDGNCHEWWSGEPNTPVRLVPNLQQPQLSTWVSLYGAAYPNQDLTVDLDLYPFLFQLWDGTVLMCGGRGWEYNAELFRSRKLNTALGVWVPQQQFGPMANITGISACMYQANRVLKVGRLTGGGGTCGDPNNKVQGTGEAQIIDVGPTGTAQWVTIPSMSSFRAHFYLVPLANGQVLAVGGPGNVDGPTNIPPDVWDPYENVWRTYDAAPGVNRDYHSSALLLPDGSVFIGGSDCEPRASKSYQIFKPQYFFDWRPTITNVQSAIYYNQGFPVFTPDADLISKVRLIRLGAATHSFDQNTRSMELNFIVGPNHDRILPGAVNIERLYPAA